MTAFYLIITFFAASNGPALTSQTMPGPYYSVVACDAAGASAKQHFNGGATVEWTCVPAT